MCSVLGITHSPFGHRVDESRVDETVKLIGAYAPERLGAVQISGKNVDMNIMCGTYTEWGGGNKIRTT